MYVRLMVRVPTGADSFLGARSYGCSSQAVRAGAGSQGLSHHPEQEQGSWGHWHSFNSSMVPEARPGCGAMGGPGLAHRWLVRAETGDRLYCSITDAGTGGPRGPSRPWHLSLLSKLDLLCSSSTR